MAFVSVAARPPTAPRPTPASTARFQSARPQRPGRRARSHGCPDGCGWRRHVVATPGTPRTSRSRSRRRASSRRCCGGPASGSSLTDPASPPGWHPRPSPRPRSRPATPSSRNTATLASQRSGPSRPSSEVRVSDARHAALAPDRGGELHRDVDPVEEVHQPDEEKPQRLSRDTRSSTSARNDGSRGPCPNARLTPRIAS